MGSEYWKNKLIEGEQFYYDILLYPSQQKIILELMDEWNLRTPADIIRKCLSISSINFNPKGKDQLKLQILKENFDVKSINELFGKLADKYYVEVRAEIMKKILSSEFENLNEEDMKKKLKKIEKHPIIQELLKK